MTFMIIVSVMGVLILVALLWIAAGVWNLMLAVVEIVDIFHLKPKSRFFDRDPDEGRYR